MGILNITDGVVVLALLFFFVMGWRKGLFRSILGPIALVICGYLGYNHYKQSEEIFVSLLIVALGPLILNILFWILLKVFRRKDDKESPRLFIGSLLGAVFSVFWRGSIFVLFLFLIANLHIRIAYLSSVQDNILESYGYAYLYNNLGDKIPALNFNTKGLAEVLDDPQKLEELQSKDAYTNLMANPKVKNLYDDADIQKQIDEKNYTELLNNPKIQEVLKDGELRKQFFDLYKEIGHITGGSGE